MKRQLLRTTTPGYTLVEMLTATALMLVMMGALANFLGQVGGSIANSRATLEMSERLRATCNRLKNDLDGVTARMIPPRRPEANEGYFEYTEGPVGPVYKLGTSDVTNIAINTTESSIGDTTVGDTDDILLFTTRSRSEPFSGKIAGNSAQSQEAEIAWFVRGRTLYRRVLLISPQATGSSGVSPTSFYMNYDLSARLWGSVMVANTLGDLTKPECRFAHAPLAVTGGTNTTYPHHPYFYSNATSGHGWGNTGFDATKPPSKYPSLGLPLLQECAKNDWLTTHATGLQDPGLTASGFFDAWRRNPSTWSGVDADTGAITTYGNNRIAEDVILNNVISFDVKAWDPGAPVMSNNGIAVVPGDPGYASATGSPIGYGAYVDLGWNTSYSAASGAPVSYFYRNNWDSGTTSPFGPRSELTRVYDTWSTHYESDGVKETGNRAGLTTDAGTNGFDDNSDGVVDDINEAETQAPYPYPLRGIQVKIRVFDPDTRQIREMTVVHDFVLR